MKQAISQESLSDPGHSYSPQEGESASSTGRVKSAAMLGLALSVGASGALVSGTEASAAVSSPAPTETTKAFSSNSKVSADETARAYESSQAEVVAYHTVESGESLWQIAQHHRVGLRDLKFANELPPETAIRVGQILRVPGANKALQVSEPIEADSSAQITFESVSSSEPVLLAQTVEEEVSTEAQALNHGTVADEQGGQISAFEITERPTAQIEIADASTPTDSAPVVTALAANQANQSFSSYQIQAGDTLASIASSLGTTTQDIIDANGLTNPNVIITGSTLRVPASSGQPIAAKTDARPSGIRSNISSPASGRLAHLQSTAYQPDSARILTELRSATPAMPASVGGETVTEQDVISSAATGEQDADPFVANLLEDVEAVRETAVTVSEVSQVETRQNIARTRGSDRPSLLARSERGQTSEPAAASESVAISPSPATTASPDLLAAAPISPSAYTPAQRPSAGQVVSPDMPILPEAGEFLPEAPEYFDGYIWPAQGTVTSGYGWRWGRMHRGVDVAGPVGTPIVAAAMGVVEQAGWNSGGYGNMVEIRHPDGSLTRYAHNNRLNVSAGQTVRQGQQIAEMGSTGYSTGPHLHFEVHMNGQGAVNPVAYLPGR